MDLLDRLPECSIDELDDCCDGIKSDALEILDEWNSEEKPTATGNFFQRLQQEIIQEVERGAEFMNEEERESEIEPRISKIVELIADIKASAFKWELYMNLDRSILVADIPEREFEKVELEDQELVSSHEHKLEKHPDNFPASWHCDRIRGA